MKFTYKLFLVFMLLFICTGQILADVTLPAVIGSNMVLQQNKPLKIWGWAEPGENVTVEIEKNKQKAKTDKQGNWNVTLPEMKAGGPYVMTIKGNNTVTLENVLVGEVWICSGQSNMQWSMRSVQNNVSEILAANNPKIRFLQVKRIAAGFPQKDVSAKWQECNPQTAIDFSAIGYFYGKNLFDELDVPIGLINSSWGGTRIEPWTPPAGFKSVQSLQDIVTEIETAGDTYKVNMEKSLNDIEKWLTEAKTAFAANTDIPDMPKLATYPLQHHQKPTALYNGMIHGLVPFAFRGAIWYQGESNRGDGLFYFDKMQALINGWRTVWGQDDFPFYYVQLAPYSYAYKNTKDGNALKLAQVREGQRKALTIANTGMIVTTDIGNVLDIHPRNKQEVGRRLALWALAKTYGQKDLVYSGPLYKSYKILDGKIQIQFDFAENGLASKDGKPLDWFEIAGPDNIFVKAQARLYGDKVEVWSSEVENPVSVRFGWHEEATPNLINKEGLPASPFHTDTK